MIFENSNLFCTRCSREKVLGNLKHTRLRGYLCVCGNDEWEERRQQVANELGRVVRVELAVARAIVEEVAAMGDNFDFEGIESLVIQANEFLAKYPRVKDGDANG